MSMSPVTAADHGGSLPLASISCPDAGEEIKAEHIRTPVAALLAECKWLRETQRTTHTFAEENATSPFEIGPPNTFTTNTWTDSKVTINVAGCLVGDDLDIDLCGDWQLNTASTATVIGRGRIEITEDASGTPTIVPNLYGKASIHQPTGVTLPFATGYALKMKHRVTTAGTAKVTFQVRREDLSGGAGTGTVILWLSARLDVVRYRRS